MEERNENVDQAEGIAPRPDVIGAALPPVDPAGAVPALDPAGALPGDASCLDAEVEAEEGPEQLTFLRWLGELLVLLAIAFVLAFGIKTFIVQPFYIPSGSMEHTLEVGDRVLVNKFLYRFAGPKPGDVVVFESPQTSSTDYIKRVIAIEGQTVDVRGGVVYVDGKALDEPYVNRETPDANEDILKPVTVPPGHVWVMGDNRGNSTDSRIFGPQPASHVLGKAFAIYWPFTRFSGL